MFLAPVVCESSLLVVQKKVEEYTKDITCKLSWLIRVSHVIHKSLTP